MPLAKGYAVDPAWRLVFQALKLDAARTLKRAGLPENYFARLPDLLPPEEYFRFLEAVDTELGEQDLALALYDVLSVEMFSPPIFAAVCSPNLKLAARRVAEHKPLVGPMQLNLTDNSAGLTIGIKPPVFPRPPLCFYLFEVLFWVYLVRQCTREQIVPLRFQIPERPDSILEYEALLGARVSIGAECEIVFSSEVAEKPFLTQNDFTWAAFKPEMQRRLSELEHDASMWDQVQSVLLEALPAGLATMAYVARKLRVSERTLQRRLKEENTSFQHILSTTRAELSRHYLKETVLPYAEVAYLLGYKDTNSFYRAFKDWEDATPEQFRTG